MGLFGKKEACPVCGGEVKGLFNKKISGKQTLCKDCSSQVSMSKELLKEATPDFMKEHLAYRRSNAEKYSSLHWTVEYEARNLKMGVDPAAGYLYLREVDMDDLDNPVVFAFDQITHYELYRVKSKLDDTETPGEVFLETNLSALGGIAKIVGGKKSNTYEYYRIVLKTAEPYWPELNIEIPFDSPDDVHGILGFGKDLKRMCQVLKGASRREPINLY